MGDPKNRSAQTVILKAVGRGGGGAGPHPQAPPGLRTHLCRPQHRLHEQLLEGLVVLGGQDTVLGEAHLQPQRTQVAPERGQITGVRV